MENILPNLFKIEIPLPQNPLQSINSYVIKGQERNLIIDTAMNREICLAAMQEGLQALNIDLTQTDFFITHMHADHAGLVDTLMTDGSTAYCSQLDADIINKTAEADWSAQLEFAYAHGFPQQRLQEALQKHPGYLYGTKKHVDFKIIQDQDVIQAGDYTLICIATPGHTEGHMCLYEPRRKILFSGDHILGCITPNISLWMEGENPLQDYLASLDKVSAMAVDLMLPAHRRAIKDGRARIDQLKEHHQNRLNEVLHILAQKTTDAYHVAQKMTWDIKFTNWDDFPLAQKWFATGEALSHLVYLERKGLIKQQLKDGKFLFSR